MSGRPVSSSLWPSAVVSPSHPTPTSGPHPPHASQTHLIHQSPSVSHPRSLPVTDADFVSTDPLMSPFLNQRPGVVSDFEVNLFNRDGHDLSWGVGYLIFQALVLLVGGIAFIFNVSKWDIVLKRFTGHAQIEQVSMILLSFIIGCILIGLLSLELFKRIPRVTLISCSLLSVLIPLGIAGWSTFPQLAMTPLFLVFASLAGIAMVRLFFTRKRIGRTATCIRFAMRTFRRHKILPWLLLFGQFLFIACFGLWITIVFTTILDGKCAPQDNLVAEVLSCSK